MDMCLCIQGPLLGFVKKMYPQDHVSKLFSTVDGASSESCGDYQRWILAWGIFGEYLGEGGYAFPSLFLSLILFPDHHEVSNVVSSCLLSHCSVSLGSRCNGTGIHRLKPPKMWAENQSSQLWVFLFMYFTTTRKHQTYTTRDMKKAPPWVCLGTQ